MEYFILLIFVIGYAEATCDGNSPIKPVCGSNNVIYYNECHMKDEVYGKVPYPVYPVAWEQCSTAECNHICNRIFIPVCGSDGEIGDNPCAFLGDVCEKKQYIYEVDLEFCLSKKCPNNCSVNDEKCIHEWKMCRYGFAGIVP